LIGNEILSGRTADANLHYLAKELAFLGIALIEARVVADRQKAIVDAVRALKKSYDMVFVTGGIGPTHDDITTAAIAKAFGVPALKNPEAFRRLEAHYAGTSQPFNQARQKMARIPKGARLIDNPISAAPGYQIKNVYVMAGVPVIMQAMFDSIRSTLQTGERTRSATLTTTLTEGVIASELEAIQNRHRKTEIGSYPHIRDGRLGVALVVRSLDEAALTRAVAEITLLLKRHGGKILSS
jgi:molybdenum cofactor synthesis domain-containing protein